MRDTATWNDLGFEGQTALMHLLRRANLAGAVYLPGGWEPWQAATQLCGVPEAIARAGVARLLELGCALVEAGRLVFPRYVAAQSAAASAAQRQREHRARQKIEAGILPDESQNVTADQTVWDPVFGARRKASDNLLAVKGAAWLSEATGLEPWPVGGRWGAALAELAGKPQAERDAAARVLRCSARQPGIGRILTPQHVLDYWPAYRAGQAPGAKHNGVNGHAGPAPAPPEVELARTESERWKAKYERARTDYERNEAAAKWLEADRKLKSAKDKAGWNT